MQIYPLTIDKTEEKSDCVKFTSIGSGYSCRPFWPWLRMFYMGAECLQKHHWFVKKL